MRNEIRRQHPPHPASVQRPRAANLNNFDRLGEGAARLELIGGNTQVIQLHAPVRNPGMFASLLFQTDPGGEEIGYLFAGSFGASSPHFLKYSW
jgi:hypothetical protein